MALTSASTSSTAGAAKMRMIVSCSGCRALRKGCSEDCTIRPCQGWIKDPVALGHATSFLAKFYGRAGLQNLIEAAPDADRQAVFRSLLHEACGRIVNPVYGAVGLLWSRQWQKCVDAVEDVFKGTLAVPAALVIQEDPSPIVQADADAAPPPLAARPGASSAAYDIRHFAKDSDGVVAADLLRFARAGRKGFKRAGSSSNSSNAKLLRGKGKAKFVKGKASNDRRASPNPPLGQQQEAKELEPVPMVMELEHDGGRDKEYCGSHGHHLHLQGSKENTDVSQVEAELPVGNQVLAAGQEAEEDVGLELRLGFEPVVRQQPRSSCGDQTGSSGLRLQLPA